MIQIDTNNISDAALNDLLHAIPLDDEAQQIVRRVVTRLAEIAIQAINATGEFAVKLQHERNALVATLASLGEEKAAAIQARVEGFLSGLFDRALSIALGRLGL